MDKNYDGNRRPLVSPQVETLKLTEKWDKVEALRYELETENQFMIGDRRACWRHSEDDPGNEEDGVDWWPINADFWICCITNE